jgi:hypothetical protein
MDAVRSLKKKRKPSNLNKTSTRQKKELQRRSNPNKSRKNKPKRSQM